MGLIEDGKVSGNLPSSEVFAVHYPGYPSSTSRAIQTLGGSESILKARSSSSHKLELHFRPEDPYSHPTFGELHSCNNLLLRISKKKLCDGLSSEPSDAILQHPSPDASNLGGGSEVCQPPSDSVVTGQKVEVQTSKEGRVNLFADIVAQVSEAYNFNGMADYQHVVAVHADVARRKKRNWTEVEEPHFEKGGLMDLEEDDVMMMLPPLFAPKDVPENLVLRPSAIPNSAKKEVGVAIKTSEMDIESGLAIDFNIKEIPEKVNWEEFVSQDSEQWKWQMAVSKLFDERPIWPKSSIMDRMLDDGLKFNSIMLKRLLLGIAYYFSNGPFLRFWIKKGYDPRKDPESRIYQRIDFRVKPQLRSYCESNAAAECKHRWKDLCAFQVFPTKCSTSLQLFELVDDYIQQEIRKPIKLTTCSLQTGWFSRYVIAVIRKRVEMRFLSVYPGVGAQKLLKSTSESFERLRRMCTYKDTLTPDHEQQHQVNKGDGDKEKPEVDNDEDGVEVDEDGIEVDEEEDRMEADDGEEESDADEAQDLVADDDEISLQSNSYLDLESNSRTYLQELFGSFPSTNVNGDKVQHDDISEEEYEIYEQDSDDSYSGGDNDN
ncbi:general transcription factor 3C polypeptide 5-like [Melia azedarach]|uniref:General transcription factor 3C polypeptide 5-like n=1 Tax=Melia azedarach TaxID=155640 RepID=A0ACC1XVK7_MELAZ|nr:general transcription factor 3C polypeptide 5-like [Melia azedarach]